MFTVNSEEENEIDASKITNTLIPAKNIPPDWHFHFHLDETSTLAPFIEEARQAPTFRRQIELLLHLNLPLRTMARIFQCSVSSVQYQKAALAKTHHEPGRPTKFTSEVREQIMEFVHASLDERIPPTVEDIRRFIYDTFELEILPDTLRHWLRRRPEYVLQSVPPIEAARFNVDPDDISQYFEDLRKIIQDEPADLICNFDETGFDAFADATERYVVAPVERAEEARGYPVTRNEKRVTLLACITASGRRLKPLVISGRKTIDDELFELGYTPDDVMFPHSATGYMTSTIFAEWLEEVFVPYINEQRAVYGSCAYGYALADNCTAHEGDMIDDIMTENGIYSIPLVSHSSDKTQMLDLGLFGTVKTAQSRIYLPDGLSTQTTQIARLLAAWGAVAHPPAITACWRQAGINPYWDPESGWLRVDVDARARKVTENASQNLRLPHSRKRTAIGSLSAAGYQGPQIFLLPESELLESEQELEDWALEAHAKIFDVTKEEVPEALVKYLRDGLDGDNPLFDEICSVEFDEDDRDPDFNGGPVSEYTGQPRRNARRRTRVNSESNGARKKIKILLRICNPDGPES